MDTVTILLRQVLQMFLLVALGYLLFRGKKITPEGSRTLGNILIYLVLPCVIINGFRIERTPEHLRGLLFSAVLAAVLLAVSMLVARAFFRKDSIANFAASFSNPGFFGVPLITAAIGQGAIFYVAFFIAFLNILQWTYGVSLMNGQKLSAGFSPRKLIRAPFVIAMLIGLVLFFSSLQLPQVVSGCMTGVAALNTPLSMFTVGVYLAQTDIPGIFRRGSLYLVSLARLAVAPLIACLLLALLPQSFYDMKLALLLAAACPVGSNVAVYAQLHGKDYPYAVETVVLSTLFSILTIPAIVSLAGVLW
ncbi:MAG: AEC family transporter [Clostridia bacterium]|nr:AEC family transporter [Clostridia bacterium]